VRRTFLLTVLMMGMALSTVFAQQESPSQPPDDVAKPKAKVPMTDEQRAQLEQRLDAQWSKMPVEAKTKLMRLHRALSEMPPDERRFIHERIERFLNMSPAEREKLQQNRQRWEQMSPEQRQKAREEFHKRRQEIEEKWHHEHPGGETSSNMMHDSKSPSSTEAAPQSPAQPATP
jgi:Protein of unknown function (DUF3106)